MSKLLIVLAAVLLVSCASGPRTVPTAIPTTPTIAPPSTAVGAKRLLRGTPGAPVGLMVSEGEFYMAQRAAQEGSRRTLGDPEIVKVTYLAEVMILQANEAGVQVQVNEGTQAGRRGWLNRSSLSQ